MKIQSSRGRMHISVNARGTGEGVVIQQGQHRVLMSWSEWREVRDAADGLYTNQPPKRIQGVV